MMRKFIIKFVVLSIIIYVIIVSINYVVDPANILHTDSIDSMVSALSQGKTIVSPGDYEEGTFQRKRIEKLDEPVSTIVIGSSHVMFIPWNEKFDDVLVLGLSGAYLGDYYSLIGILERNRKLPKHLIIGIDPWIFEKECNDGRHRSISSYGIYEDKLIREKNLNYIEFDTYKMKVEKIKELFSFQYFQSSFYNLKKLGFDFNKLNKDIVIANNDDIGDRVKITPWGTAILAVNEICTPDNIEQTALAAIEEESIYQLVAHDSDWEPDSYDEFVNLLDHLKKSGIEVEIYFPSWYPTLFDYFASNDNYSYLIALEEKIRYTADKYGIVVHGSFSPYECGIKKEDFFDWLHLYGESGLRNYEVVK